MSLDHSYPLINTKQTSNLDKRPVETAYGLLWSQSNRFKPSHALQAMTQAWATPENWWQQFSVQIAPPAPTQCPVCQLGQRIGVVRATLSEPALAHNAPEGETPPALRTFEITYSGHPHMLFDWDGVPSSGQNNDPNTPLPDLLLIRDRTQEQRHNDFVCRTIQQYESICTFVQDVYYRMDMKGTLLFVSPSCQKLLLYRPEDLIGTQFTDRLTTQENFHELLEILKNTRVIHDFQLPLQCKQNRHLPVSMTAKLVLDSNGLPIAIEGIFRDVSERDRLGSLLEEQTQIYRHSLSSLEQLKDATDQHVLISIVDPEGNILTVNDKFLEVSRYDASEVVGQNHRIFNSGYHPKSFFKELWRTILNGSIWRGEIRNRKKNGEFFWVDCSIVPCLTPLGHPFQYIWVATDISHLVRTRTRLERNRNFLHRVIDAIGEGVMVMDLQGQLLSLNQEGERLLGWREAELIHKNVHEAIHARRVDGSPFPAEECMVHQSLLGRIFRVEQDHFIRKDGSFLPVSHITAPLRDDEEMIGSVAIFQDNSRIRKRLQELERERTIASESARLKSEFLANMSHEIRTPMNAIIGMNDLLMDTPMNEEQEEFCDIIRDSAKSLLSLINDILDFSKIEAGRMDIEEIEFSPVTVIEGCAELLAAQAHDKGLSLMTFIDPELPKILKGDPGRLRQMVLNLMNNAIKFTEEGEIVVRVQRQLQDPAAPVSKDRLLVRFAISDTGIGLSEQVREKLFEPFTQGDRTTSRKYGGTGLGLAITKRLAELMGGSIGTEPDGNQGTTFWFTLPLQPTQTASSHEENLSRTVLPGVHALTLLSRKSDQEILDRYLRAWGLIHHSSLYAGTLPDRSWQQLTQELPNNSVVIMTLSAQALHEPSLLQRPLPAGNQHQWIALLEQDDKSLRELAASIGFATSLVKPVRQEEWLHSLLRLLTPLNNEELATANTSWPADLAGTPAIDTFDALESGRLVLLVEDNPVNQKVTLLQLKKLGYAAHAVGNGREAVEAVANLPYALVLMDCQMPVMDGFEATHAIRKMEQTTLRHTPIVAMTANAMKGDRERCLQAGMDDYLSKPVAPNILLKKLQYWMPKGTHSQPAIEIQQLRQLFGEDDGMVRELLQQFPASVRELLDRLWQYIREQNGELLHDTAFELQEACANMGASSMSACANSLEKIVAKGDWEQALLLMDQLEHILRQVEHYVQNYETLSP
ncbi:MAG: PAS domain S-box protein [Magnetococcales bacterium]|nr:PAS domain S-box protein [Magnetococcales bacterium]